MSDWNQDPWIVSNSMLTPEKLHALGVLTLKWSVCEYWTGAIFSDVLGVSERVAVTITHDLGDIAMWNKIVNLAEARGLAPQIIEELKHASKVYDICRSNRNQFVHAATIMKRNQDGSLLSLGRKKGPTLNVPELGGDLEHLRRVCDDLTALNRYLSDLCLGVARPQKSTWPLPGRPSLPEFVWKPPPQNPPKQKRPLRSSKA